MEPKTLKPLYNQLQVVIVETNRIHDSPDYIAVSSRIKEKTTAHLKEITGQLVSIQSAIQAIEAESQPSSLFLTGSPVKSMTEEEITVWGKRIENAMVRKEQLNSFGTIAYFAPETIQLNQQVKILLEVATPLFAALIQAEAVAAAAKMTDPAPDAVLKERAMKYAVELFELASDKVREHNAK